MSVPSLPCFCSGGNLQTKGVEPDEGTGRKD